MVEVCPGGGCIAAQRPVGGVQGVCESVGGILPGGGRKALQLRIAQVEVQRFAVADKVGLGVYAIGACRGGSYRTAASGVSSCMA